VGLEHLGARFYPPLLARALAGPGVTLAVSASMLMVALGALAGGWVPYAFLPNVEGDFVAVRLAMPDGTPPEVVERALFHLESEAAALGVELEEEEGHPVFESVLSAVGDRPDRHDDFQVGGEGPNVAHVAVQLLAGERRDVTSLEVKERWREAVGAIPGALSLVFRGSDFSPNRPIDVSLSGPDPEELQRASEALKRALAAHPGVREIADSQSGGKQELALRIRPEAESLGLSLAELARQVRQGFHGEEVQRVQRGRDDVVVRVRYPLAERRSLRDLESTWLRLPDGRELPFSAVAEADVGVGYASVERRDRRRNIAVTADVDYSVSHPRTVLADLSARDFPRIAAGSPGLRFDLDGQTREEAEMTARLWRGFLLAMIATYALLAVPLRSYLQPLLIVVAIPFGLVGGIVGHLLLGLQVSAFSMIGVVALTGVVVNDALLLIDRANRRREAGDDVRSALLEACAARFRPILLTSLTTFFGLMPLLFEQSAQALWLKPMAVTLAFGVMFATGITLLIVPAAYVVLEEAIAWGRRLLAARTNGPAAIR
jgi:multidrug efflux pump subunit AcrB